MFVLLSQLIVVCVVVVVSSSSSLSFFSVFSRILFVSNDGWGSVAGASRAFSCFLVGLKRTMFWLIAFYPRFSLSLHLLFNICCMNSKQAGATRTFSVLSLCDRRWIAFLLLYSILSYFVTRHMVLEQAGASRAFSVLSLRGGWFVCLTLLFRVVCFDTPN
jgi:hypothetical protein